MIAHVCPICEKRHEVRLVRAALAYGRQLTCSPDCESERRKRMRRPPGDEPVSPVLHTWVVAKTHADFMRATAILNAARNGRR